VLLSATETKLNIRNLFVWLNKSFILIFFLTNSYIYIYKNKKKITGVIKTCENENEVEIQNHKFALKEY
jgi:hypothetical protein